MRYSKSELYIDINIYKEPNVQKMNIHIPKTAACAETCALPGLSREPSSARVRNRGGGAETRAIVVPEGPSHLRANPEQPDPGGPELPLLLNKVNPVDERPDSGQDDYVLVLKGTPERHIHTL